MSHERAASSGEAETCRFRARWPIRADWGALKRQALKSSESDRGCKHCKLFSEYVAIHKWTHVAGMNGLPCFNTVSSSPSYFRDPTIAIFWHELWRMSKQLFLDFVLNFPSPHETQQEIRCSKQLRNLWSSQVTGGAARRGRKKWINSTVQITVLQHIDTNVGSYHQKSLDIFTCLFYVCATSLSSRDIFILFDFSSFFLLGETTENVLSLAPGHLPSRVQLLRVLDDQVFSACLKGAHVANTCLLELPNFSLLLSMCGQCHLQESSQMKNVIRDLLAQSLINELFTKSVQTSNHNRSLWLMHASYCGLNKENKKLWSFG